MPNQNRPTEEFRKEHEHLMHHVDDLRRTLDALRGGLSPDRIAGLKEADWFLTEALKPHAQWEEANLYPLADEIVRQYGKPSATMEVDHQDLVRRIDDFRREVETLTSGPVTAEQIDRLRILGYQIEGILRLHFRKEEEVYLEAIDQHARPETIKTLMEAAQSAHAH